MSPDVFQSAVTIPGYSCEALIGRGGMGSVYRAIQLAHHRPVAIKVLAETYRDDPNFIARFQQEANLLVSLEHPHIVPLLDSGSADGVPYIVMRLIDGPTLRELIRLDRPEPIAALRLLRGVAAALDFAHANGVLHRDIKPHNVLVDHGGHVWLADFGLTKLLADVSLGTATSGFAGTFDYLAPEIAAGQPATVASDVYALGVTAFQTLTGELPFVGDPVAAVLQAHAAHPRPAASAIEPALPSTVDSVLADAMAIDPTVRPNSAGELVDALAGALGIEAQMTVGPRTQMPSLASLPPLHRSGLDAHTPISSEAESDAWTRVPKAGGDSSAHQHHRRFVGVAVVSLACATAIVLALLNAFPASNRASTSALYAETVGGPSHTWFNYRLANELEGPTIAGGQTVQISCRLHGFRVQDGDVWWYRIASKPWDEQFYVSADAFYNDGRRSGSLHGTPFYDARVPVCSSFAEVPGNSSGTYTWTNYRTAGGAQGKLLAGFKPADVVCRVRGLKAPDGDRWWYRIGGPPWDGHFYASADSFYNNGEMHGTLHGSAFVDLNVPLC